MELMLGILQGLGIFVALPALIGIIVADSFLLWDSRASAKQGIAKLACSVDTDCPLDFICLDGHCVPRRA